MRPWLALMVAVVAGSAAAIGYVAYQTTQNTGELAIAQMNGDERDKLEVLERLHFQTRATELHAMLGKPSSESQLLAKWDGFAGSKLSHLQIYLAERGQAREIRWMKLGYFTWAKDLLNDPDRRKPIYFSAIDDRSAKAGWGSLREVSLPRESLEVRIWIGFGVGPLEAISMRRDGIAWTGRHLWAPPNRAEPPTSRSVSPRGSWEDLWARLTGLGLLVLPDSSRLPTPPRGRVADGVSYVVEIRDAGRYRTYMYSNPQHEQWREAKQMIQLIETLESEFLRRP